MRIATGLVDDRCPICGKVAVLDSSADGDEPLCAPCGQLLRWFRQRLCSDLGINPESVKLGDELPRTGVDSLDLFEMILELDIDIVRRSPGTMKIHGHRARDRIGDSGLLKPLR